MSIRSIRERPVNPGERVFDLISTTHRVPLLGYLSTTYGIIGLKNLAYNMRRLVQLERLAAAV